MSNTITVFTLETATQLAAYLKKNQDFNDVWLLLQAQINAASGTEAVVVVIPQDRAVALFHLLANVAAQADSFRTLAQALATSPGQ